MKSGRIYPRVMASWVWLQAQSPCMISNDSLTGNRTQIRHQLHSLIGFGHVTVWHPCSSRMADIAIVWLGTRIANFPRFAISLSQNRKFAILWQAVIPSSCHHFEAYTEHTYSFTEQNHAIFRNGLLWNYLLNWPICLVCWSEFSFYDWHIVTDFTYYK